jgi:hypothetical protein
MKYILRLGFGALRVMKMAGWFLFKRKIQSYLLIKTWNTLFKWRARWLKIKYRYLR